MSNSEFELLSPGRIVLLWRIIFLVNRYGKVEIQKIITTCQNLGILGGTIPVKQAIKLGQQCKLIEVNDGKINLTADCTDNYLPLCKSEEPNLDFIKALLFKVIITNKYTWLLFFNEDVEIFKVAMPSEWIDLLQSAGLLDFHEPPIIGWWQEILSAIQKYNQKKCLEIGEVGEILTFEFETHRLLLDGVNTQNFYIKWVSKISDTYGYDFISVKGTMLGDGTNIKEKILIEAKSSIIMDSSSFPFYLTRNEWNAATDNMDSYYIYCWVGIDIKYKKAKNGPYIVPVRNIEKLIPINPNDECVWTECRFELDLNKYAINNAI